MAPAGSRVEEPELTVLPRPRSFFQRRRFLWSFLPTALLGIAGVIALLVSSNLLLPFRQVVTLQGKVASKADFFEDEEVQRILIKNHIRVHVTRSGSREIATHDIDSYDFVMPSGQPSADLVVKGQYGHTKVYRPFTTPLVLATYREYAEALVGAGVATREKNSVGPDTLYYDLDTERFLNLVQSGKTWHDLEIQQYGANNLNRVIAQTSNVCNSNSAGTYLGIVAFIKNDKKIPQTEQEADLLGAKIRPLLTSQGLPPADMFVPYITPEGRGTAPIVVVYENQYLNYQIQYRENHGRADMDRVLLYPSAGFETAPQLISLDSKADQLGDLLINNPALMLRAMELGYRVLDPSGATTSDQLSQFLVQHGIHAPQTTAEDTKTYLPRLSLLERMIIRVGDCP